MNTINPILMTDSYKVTHWPVYPENTEFVYSYLESRGGPFSETVMFGLNYYLKRYLQIPLTMEMIDYAEQRFAKHFGTGAVFNRAGFEYIVNVHKGIWPIRIKAVPEGTVVPPRNVLMTMENTDPKCYWVTNYLETLLLKVWYPITVATLSREIKKIVLAGLVKTGNPDLLPFKVHDFGYRGVSSEESAGIGGMSHLTQFLGTDTLAALEYAKEFYGEDIAGFSIPATEHSIMTAKGENGEVEMMKRFLDTFQDGPFPAIACVSDTYNIYRAVTDYWGGQLKGQVENMNDKVLVVRPDSGDPLVIVVQVIEALDAKFGHTVNEKGYKVLNHVRVIQGDGVNITTVRGIIERMEVGKWSIDNIAFGIGGALLQALNRDTMRFAIKASSYIINGIRKDYQKNPVTDSGKRSKAGRLKLVYENGVYTTVGNEDFGQDILETVFEDGKILMDPTFAEIRERSKLEVVQPEFSVI